ncbi:MAG: metallophosphoesterase family protein [Halodesulfovibrio sp.]
MPAPITIAHLSDLHLTAQDNEKRTGPGRLKGMNRNFARLMQDRKLLESDYIIVTGDITDRGYIAAWRRFWDEVNKAGVLHKIIVVPGNHDMCSLRLIRNIPTEESRAMAEHGLALGGQPTVFPWAKSVENRTIAFFGLNSNNEGNTLITANAIGKLGFEQLYKLGRMLSEEYADVPIKLLLLHHSPNIPEVATSERRHEKPTYYLERNTIELDKHDRRQLRLLCRVFRIKAILHGHTHNPLNRTVNGVRIISAPPSTEPDKDGFLHYFRYTISPGTGRLSYSTVKVEAPK